MWSWRPRPSTERSDARVERTLLSVAFDLAFDFDLLSHSLKTGKGKTLMEVADKQRTRAVTWKSGAFSAAKAAP